LTVGAVHVMHCKAEEESRVLVTMGCAIPCATLFHFDIVL